MIYPWLKCSHWKLVCYPSNQSPSVQESRVQVSSRSNSKVPSVQSLSVKTSIVQASSRSESKGPVIQSPDVQNMRSDSSFSGMP